MESEHLEIISAFSSGINIELTINQIAKNIGKSYAYTNRYVHEMITLGVLKMKEIGPSMLCRLDYSSQSTLALLATHSMEKAITFKDKSQKEMSVSASYSAFDIVLLKNQKLKVISPLSRNFQLELKKIILDPSSPASQELMDVIILQNSELFWREIIKLLK